MEISQESSPKPLTKSSRKRLRKKQAAALEKSLTDSQVASLSKRESTQSQEPGIEEKRGDLHKIVFPPQTSLGKQEFIDSGFCLQDTVNKQEKTACCEGSEKTLFEKSLGPDKESAFPRLKRRRNCKKAIGPEENSDHLWSKAVSAGQESVDSTEQITQHTQHHATSQKDCAIHQNKLISTPSFSHGADDDPVNLKGNHSQTSIFTEGVSKTGDPKPKEEESTLSRSKRRRNRKKNNASSENSGLQEGTLIVENTRSKIVPECSHLPLTEPLSSKKGSVSEQEIISSQCILVNLENPALSTRTQSHKNIFEPEPLEITVGKKEKSINDKGNKVQKICVLSEKLSDVGKENCAKNLTTPGEHMTEVGDNQSEVDKDLLAHKKNAKAVTAVEHDSEDCIVKPKHREAITTANSLELDCLNPSVISHQTDPQSFTTVHFAATSGSQPKVTDRTQKNIHRFGGIMDENTNKDKGRKKEVYVSKGAPVSKKVAVRQGDETDRLALAVNRVKIDKKFELCKPEVDSQSGTVFGEMECEIKVQSLGKVSPVTEKEGGRQVDLVDGLSEDMGHVVMNEKPLVCKEAEPSEITSKEEDKSRESVKAEREARKVAKLAKKQKDKVTEESKVVSETISSQPPIGSDQTSVVDKKDGKAMGEKSHATANTPPQQEGESIVSGKSKAEVRAERRAKQEAQRAAKASSNTVAAAQAKVKNIDQGLSNVMPRRSGEREVKPAVTHSKGMPRKEEKGAKLLSRLGWDDRRLKRSPSEGATLQDTQAIHPAITQLSTRFTDRIISGSNARCLAFVQAIKKAIVDYQTPPQKELGRDLEARLLTSSLGYLESQRPHAVSVLNATKFLKWQLTQLQSHQQDSLETTSVPYSGAKRAAVITDEEAKQRLIEGLDAYVWEKIEVAERAVCDTLRDKIKDGDVILTYGCSYLLQQILMGAKKSGTKFKVVVVDGRPWREGREMLRCLVAVGIPCSYVLLSAASSVMRQVNKVLLGAHALLSNGYVMSRVGVSQVALLANAHNVPVLVACETHKFCERVQSDSFVYNEMGEPDGLAQLLGGEDGPLAGWRSIPSLSLLNLSYDVTPPELVTAVATELAVLPCTSVPVVLRVRPAEPIGSRH